MARLFINEQSFDEYSAIDTSSLIHWSKEFKGLLIMHILECHTLIISVQRGGSREVVDRVCLCVWRIL